MIERDASRSAASVLPRRQVATAVLMAAGCAALPPAAIDASIERGDVWILYLIGVALFLSYAGALIFVGRAGAWRMLALIAGCCTLWTLVGGGPVAYWALEEGGHTSGVVIFFALLVQAVAGASFGLLCYLQDRSVPRQPSRAAKFGFAAGLVLIPVMALEFFGAKLSVENVIFALVAGVAVPTLLSVVIAATLSAALGRRDPSIAHHASR